MVSAVGVGVTFVFYVNLTCSLPCFQIGPLLLKAVVLSEIFKGLCYLKERIMFPECHRRHYKFNITFSRT
jgi:hypothetical protein